MKKLFVKIFFWLAFAGYQNITYSMKLHENYYTSIDTQRQNKNQQLIEVPPPCFILSCMGIPSVPTQPPRPLHSVELANKRKINDNQNIVSKKRKVISQENIAVECKNTDEENERKNKKNWVKNSLNIKRVLYYNILSLSVQNFDKLTYAINNMIDKDKERYGYLIQMLNINGKNKNALERILDDIKLVLEIYSEIKIEEERNARIQELRKNILQLLEPTITRIERRFYKLSTEERDKYKYLLKLNSLEEVQQQTMQELEAIQNDIEEIIKICRDASEIDLGSNHQAVLPNKRNKKILASYEDTEIGILSSWPGKDDFKPGGSYEAALEAETPHEVSNQYYILGSKYERGRGVQKDLQRALNYFHLAEEFAQIDSEQARAINAQKRVLSKIEK